MLNVNITKVWTKEKTWNFVWKFGGFLLIDGDIAINMCKYWNWILNTYAYVTWPNHFVQWSIWRYIIRLHVAYFTKELIIIIVIVLNNHQNMNDQLPEIDWKLTKITMIIFIWIFYLNMEQKKSSKLEKVEKTKFIFD